MNFPGQGLRVTRVLAPLYTIPGKVRDGTDLVLPAIPASLVKQQAEDVS